LWIATATGQLFKLDKVPARAVKAQGFLLASKPVKSIDE
jgi:hypothetical protein